MKNLIRKYIKDADSRNRAELIRAGSTSLLNRVFGYAATYLFYFIASRYFGADGIGIFTLAATFLMVMSLIARFGLDTAVVRFVAGRHPGEPRGIEVNYFEKIRNVAFVSSGLVFVVGYAISTSVGAVLFHKPFLGTPLRIASLGIIPLTLGLIYAEGLRGLKQIKAYTFLYFVSIPVVAGGILAGFILWNGAFAKTWMIPAAWVGGVFGFCGLGIWAWKRKVIGRKAGSTLPLADLLRIAFPMFLTSSTMLLWQWSDVVMLGIFRATSDVGIYSVAQKVATVVSVSLVAVNSIAAPRLAEAFSRGDNQGFGAIIEDAKGILFWSGVLIFLLTTFLATPILGLFGNEFHGGETALVLLSIGHLINVLSGPVGYVLQMTGREKEFFRIVLFALVLNVVLNIVLIPEYGMIGAATASAVSMAVQNVTAVIYVRKAMGIRTTCVPRMTKKKLLA